MIADTYCRTLDAVARLSAQIGSRIPNTSELVTSETGCSPTVGYAYSSNLERHSCAVLVPAFQVWAWMPTTVSDASLKVGIPASRLRSARGSVPSATSRALSMDIRRAFARVTSGYAPSPTLKGTPLIRKRCENVLDYPPADNGLTNRINPYPPRPSP